MIGYTQQKVWQLTQQPAQAPRLALWYYSQNFCSTLALCQNFRRRIFYCYLSCVVTKFYVSESALMAFIKTNRKKEKNPCVLVCLKFLKNFHLGRFAQTIPERDPKPFPLNNHSIAISLNCKGRIAININCHWQNCNYK